MSLVFPTLQSNSGVYSIICLVTNKRYIGSSRRLRTRLTGHRSELRGDRHPSKHLQAAWNLYGENSFSIEILIYCDEDRLLLEEQRCLDEFKSYDPEYGFNKSSVPINAGRIARHKDRENLKAHLASVRERRITQCIASQGRSFRLQSPNGQIFEGKGVNAFCRHHGLAQSNVLLVLNGKKKTTKGWKLPETDIDYHFIDHLGRSIIIPWRGMHEFCKQHNLCYKSMRRVWKGCLLSHKGWSRYDRQDLYHTIVSPDGVEVKISRYAIHLSAQHLGLHRQGLRQLILRKQQHHHGWTLKEPIIHVCV